jgi:hypothetical protein
VGDGSPGSREAEGEGGEGFYVAQSGRSPDLLVIWGGGERETPIYIAPNVTLAYCYYEIVAGIMTKLWGSSTPPPTWAFRRSRMLVAECGECY